MKKQTIFCIALGIQAVLLAALFLVPRIGSDAVKWEYSREESNDVIKAVSVRGCDDAAVQQVNKDLQTYMTDLQAQYPACSIRWDARVTWNQRNLSVITLDADVLNMLEAEDAQTIAEWMEQNANMPLEDKRSAELWVYVEDGTVKTVLKELPDRSMYAEWDGEAA